jgi:hypothetical protein
LVGMTSRAEAAPIGKKHILDQQLPGCPSARANGESFARAL